MHSRRTLRKMRRRQADMNATVARRFSIHNHQRGQTTIK
jgi:hypothetical protein